MGSQALARKWRPRNFSEIVGQEHIVRALSHAIEQQRLHHAYLFTGTRGVGKTTIARILAKALNCLSRTSSDPCGQCSICREVDEGRFVDLIEVDAASRTKVEDTRELLENVLYAPSEGQYKVYLIDEVHMLSGHSFNALLKTLEEPPAHVKFLLATTDPQKIPATVLSRCLQFNLKRLLPEQIAQQMTFVLKQENITYELNALRALARSADGSMRDGLSLLDQAIVYGDGKISEVQVAEMLGCVARQPVTNLLYALLDNNAETLLDQVAELATFTPNYADIVQQLLNLLHHIALTQASPNLAKRDEQPDLIRDLAHRLKADEVQLFYQIGLLGRRDMPLAPDPRSGLEMLLLRMLTFRPVELHGKTKPHATITPSPVTAPSAQPVHQASTHPHISAMTSSAPLEKKKASGQAQEWAQIIESMKLTGMTKQLAQHCSLQMLDDKNCILTLDPEQAHIRTERQVTTLQTALQNYLGNPIKLIINEQKPTHETPAAQLQREKQARQQAAEQHIINDPIVQSLQERFDARILPGSIHPLDET